MDNPARVGDWMQTYTGRQFWPLDPRPDEVFIEDIAHALSRLCRYGGHTMGFYSVAEHCCHVHDAAPDHVKPWALLHDASEAYIADIIRPLKHHLPGYKEAEAKVMAAIWERFGLAPHMPPEVTEIDNRILADECLQAMRPPPAPWADTGAPLGVVVQFWNPGVAAVRFMNRFHRLNLESSNG